MSEAKYKKIWDHLMSILDDRLSYAGCNDLPSDLLSEFTEEELQVIEKQMQVDNDSPEEYDGTLFSVYSDFSWLTWLKNHAVRLIPDYGEVYCMDCKHCRIINFFDEEAEDWGDQIKIEDLIFPTCPIIAWYEKLWEVNDEGEIYIKDWSTLQPPPNCNCFEPKEGK